MGKQHVVQVPVDEELYSSIVAIANKFHSSRAEVMREAFIAYNKQVHESELDRQYREGYERVPDDSKAGKAQVGVSGQVLSRESWSEKK